MLICIRHKNIDFLVHCKYYLQPTNSGWHAEPQCVCLQFHKTGWYLKHQCQEIGKYHKHRNPTATANSNCKNKSVELRHLRFASNSRVLLWWRRRFIVKYQMCTSTPVFNCSGFTILVDIEINLQFKVIIGDFWCTFPGMDDLWVVLIDSLSNLVLLFLELWLTD